MPDFSPGSPLNAIVEDFLERNRLLDEVALPSELPDDALTVFEFLDRCAARRMETLAADNFPESFYAIGVSADRRIHECECAALREVAEEFFDARGVGREKSFVAQYCDVEVGQR